MFGGGVLSLALFILGAREKNLRYRSAYPDNIVSCNSGKERKIIASSPPTTTSTTQLQESPKTLEICLSPGCVADGADEALIKLQALSASAENSSVNVIQGVCCSLCGNGPVAKDTESGKKYRKLTTNRKLLEVLSLEEGNLDSDQKSVLEGIDLSLEGNIALGQKRYPQALLKYSQSIEKGMTAAISLSKNDDSGTSLSWLLLALCNEGFCKLQTKDVDGAIVSAGTAFQLSQKKSVNALEVLQEAYQIKGDDQQELEALEQLFALYESEEEGNPSRQRRKRPSPMEANKRRTLGFRLSKLQSSR